MLNIIKRLYSNYLIFDNKRLGVVCRSDRNRTIDTKRICKYCGWDIDEPDLEVLSFFHQDC
ncbi:hypothetical protein BH18THE2_BH18THE2_36840 [soil metagenome]